MVRLLQQQPETVLQQQLHRPQQLALRQRNGRTSEQLPSFPLLPDALLQPQAKSLPAVPEVAYTPVYENEVGVARALFSNASEYPDELAFARGAILRVIHDPQGPELSPGWWYCVEEASGARGIVPANRLELIMAHFDQGFFNVANPLFDDFFAFAGRAGTDGAVNGDLFDRRRRLFPGFVGFDDFPGMEGRARSGSLGGSPFESMRRASTATDDGAFRGIVRNIPIRVEQRESAPVPSVPTRSQASSFMKPRDDFASLYGDRPSPAARELPSNIRRAASSGQLSPTPPEDERPFRGSQATLNAGSTRLGSFADFPSSTRKTTTRDEEESPVERLAQRLRSLAARNGETVVPITVVPEPGIRSSEPSSAQQTPSPSSSGIVADMESTTATEDNKRSSAASSLSSEGGNSSFDRNSASSSSADEKTPQPVAIPRLEPASSRLRLEPTSIHRTPEERQPPPPAPPMIFPKPTSTSTSALPSVFDSMTSGARGATRKDDFLPSSIAEDMRRNDSAQWKTVPTRVNGQLERAQQQRNLSSITDSEMVGRKRALLARMIDYARMIDRALDRLRGATAPQFWREPHVLQKNLPDLRDGVATINEAVDHFVDGTARIAIDKASYKADELRALLLPLRDSRALIGALRQALDLGGWTLATLARDKRQPRTGLDSIEQFLIVVKRVPQECTAVLDWLQALQPDPPTVCFMAAGPTTLSSATGTPLAPFTAPAAPRALPTTLATPLAASPQHSPVPSDSDSKRLSSSSTTSSTVTSGDSLTSPPSSILKQPSSGRAAANGARVTFADDVDNPRSSASSLDGASSRLAQLHAHFTSAPGSSLSPAPAPSPVLASGESRILEEDDLESVLSERDSFYQDYAQLDEPAISTKPLNGVTANGKRLKISDEDRQLVRFYAPQLAQHTDALALAIDEFIDVVEHRLPPREFVQKGKLIILAAHKLIYIGDSVSQCVKDAKLSVQVRAGADHLCNLLKECVAATKSAAEEYPNIKHVQRMVDTIVGVSRAATDLKLLVESHI